MDERNPVVPGERGVGDEGREAGKRVSVFMEVEGLGDYLPKYAGNLDIMTAAALRTAEMFAERRNAAHVVEGSVP